MIAFFTIWVFMRPRTSVRKSSWRSLQRMPPRATLPPRRWMPPSLPEWTEISYIGRGGGMPPPLAAVHLDREDGARRTLVVVRAQGGADQVVEGAQDLVVHEADHRLQRL